jgi:serine/threonine protein phosphatase PrpC
MTDKLPKPEPEYYLITPNELFLFGVDGVWDREERTQLYDVVKSRPYSPAPEAPCPQKYLDCKVCEDEIRQSERENVLDKLKKWGSGYYGYEVNIQTLKEKIESLRRKVEKQ